MILVDMSAWIDFFRGREPLASMVDHLLENGEGAVCGPVLAEIRCGLRTRAERARVLSHLGGCPVLDQPSDLWNEAGDLGFVLRPKGITIKTFDLLIACYAIVHQVPLLSGDGDFKLMQSAGIPLLLA